MKIPRATYRIQFNPDFGFAKAAELAGYLSKLGISHVYASPLFKSVPGSMHGYDVTDPTQLNPELGGMEEFLKLSDKLKNEGISVLQDVVPNHMAYDSENQFLTDVFENGANSPYWNFFDIDWDHPYQNMKGRVLAPFLGKFYSECLESGEIRLAYGENGFFVTYFGLKFPISIDSYKIVMETRLEKIKQKFGETNGEFIKYLGTFNFLHSISAAENTQARYDRIKHFKKNLWSLYSENPQFKTIIDEVLLHFNGTPGNPASFDSLDRLLTVQNFRLAFWKVAAEEINYRRFFTISNLISVKVENEHVFESTHGLILKLLSEDRIQGCRIDHADGLCDPDEYFRRLRGKAPDSYIVIEKILETGENLLDRWPIQGTTGYDFLNWANSIFCDPTSEKAFSKLYFRFAELNALYEDIVFEKKRLIIGKHMAGNIDNLAQFIKKISGKHRYGTDITLYGLKRAMVDVMALFPVYRTYINAEFQSDQDQKIITDTITRAKIKNPGLTHELNFIEKFLLLKYDIDTTEEEKKEWLLFIMNFQQYTGPLMAKGLEDTVFYIYNRLTSLNEVGGNPIRFGSKVREFHEFNKKRAEKWNASLNTTATHDTKRGEDFRARLNVLSEIPQEFSQKVKYWSKINLTKMRKKDGKTMPDRNDEYFIYQTLIGSYPFENRDSYSGRLKDYVIKSVREAKVHTAWIKPDAEYEEACLNFVDKLLEPGEDNAFLKDFLPFTEKVAYYGMFNSLSQLFLKMTCPGVPDFYQGTEFWDFSFVDPDNRREVDYNKRMWLLGEISHQYSENPNKLIETLLSSLKDGRIKLFLIHVILNLRKKHSQLFEKGNYVPIEISEPKKKNVVAFARRHENQWMVGIIPRFLASLIKEGAYPTGESAWGDTSLTLPKDAPHSWKNAITGETVKAKEGKIRICDALTRFPACLLVPEAGNQ
ncbi:MAG: malto-oligosyltrehalose synthase [Endomicrobiales bacterium]|nr:malto-oligosyltrehalose synthase [Endomicrobiales bacterium]